MTKITKYTILIFLVALQVVYLIEIIERVILTHIAVTRHVTP